jgi:hypothetical protein
MKLRLVLATIAMMTNVLCSSFEDSDLVDLDDIGSRSEEEKKDVLMKLIRSYDMVYELVDFIEKVPEASSLLGREDIICALDGLLEQITSKPARKAGACGDLEEFLKEMLKTADGLLDEEGEEEWDEKLKERLEGQIRSPDYGRFDCLSTILDAVPRANELLDEGGLDDELKKRLARQIRCNDTHNLWYLPGIAPRADKLLNEGKLDEELNEKLEELILGADWRNISDFLNHDFIPRVGELLSTGKFNEGLKKIVKDGMERAAKVHKMHTPNYEKHVIECLRKMPKVAAVLWPDGKLVETPEVQKKSGGGVVVRWKTC